MPKYVFISKKIQPFKKVISVSGDKSLSIRWALLASQAIGKSRAYNLLQSEDVLSALNGLKKLGVKYLYYPKYRDIFSFKTKNKIYLHTFAKKLCGKYRPEHFKGVLNVVNRFLELLNPKYLYLGKKDFQQLILIKKHIQKNKIS